MRGKVSPAGVLHLLCCNISSWSVKASQFFQLEAGSWGGIVLVEHKQAGPPHLTMRKQLKKMGWLTSSSQAEVSEEGAVAPWRGCSRAGFPEVR